MKLHNTVWPGTVGGGAFGSDEDRKNFVLAIEKSCRIAKILNDHGMRKSGIIRIDSAGGVRDWVKDPAGNTKLIAANSILRSVLSLRPHYKQP